MKLYRIAIQDAGTLIPDVWVGREGDAWIVGEPITCCWLRFCPGYLATEKLNFETVERILRGSNPFLNMELWKRDMFFGTVTAFFAYLAQNKGIAAGDLPKIVNVRDIRLGMIK